MLKPCSLSQIRRPEKKVHQRRTYSLSALNGEFASTSGKSHFENRKHRVLVDDAFRRISSIAAMSLLIYFFSIARTPADGSETGALVLECSGSISPSVQPYSEILPSTSLTLEPNAKLVFLDYETCREVTLLGGKVSFGPNGYSAEGGHESSQRVPCPTKLAVTDIGEVAGIHSRGGTDEPISITTRPIFFLVGRRAGDFEKCEFFKNQQEVISIQLREHKCELPSDAMSLDAGSRYTLVVIPSWSSSQTIKIQIITSIPENKGGRSLFLIGSR